VVLVADGGGLVAAVRQPAEGADKVAALLAGFARVLPGAAARTMWLNGELAIRIDVEGELDTAVSVTVEGGRVTRIYAIRNPNKLAGLGEERHLSRT
jgi:RNA polymerase sigma-70 factor (ECF subfamily)